jgi:DNA-binding CsgD family transcriptional regulator
VPRQPLVMDAKPNIVSVVPRLYEAATDAGKWPVFLEELARCFGGNGAHLVRVSPRDLVLSFSVLYGFDEDIRRLYGGGGVDFATALKRAEAHFQEVVPTDPRARYIERFPNRPISCRLAIPEADLYASRIYREMLSVVDAEYAMTVNMPDDDSSLIFLSVIRSKRSKPFDEREVEAFGELIPLVKQAVALSDHLARIDFANRAGLEALDVLSMGVLIVDEYARLVHANAKARQIVDADDGLCLRNGTLTLSVRDEDACLRRAVWGAVAKPHADANSPAEAVAISRRSGMAAYPALVDTLWGNYLRYGLGRLDRPLAVVLVSVPEEPQEVPAELLQRLLGLTLAEARLCELLVQGVTVAAAARSLKIAKTTARVHLRNVFDKIGVSRQAELVAKILATPVWLRYHAGRGVGRRRLVS